MSADVRWKQRFQNFDRAYRLLADALKDGPDALSILAKEGALRRFSRTIDLAWKTLQDYLEHDGLKLALPLPRNVVKKAFAAGILKADRDWIDMLDHRNKLSHTYSERVFADAVEAVASIYLPALKRLHSDLQSKCLL